MCFEGPKPADRPRVQYRTQAHLRLDALGRTMQSPAPAAAAAARGGGPIRCEPLPVEHAGYTYRSDIAFCEGRQRAPVVLVFPNYAGKKQFDVDMAVFLARLGYVGVAVDLYKETEEYTAKDRAPTAATSEEDVNRHWKGSFTAMNDLLRDPALLQALIAKTLDVARGHPSAHPNLAGCVGYCFGGICCIEVVRGALDFQAAVSFHGLLQTMPIFVPGISGPPEAEKTFDRSQKPRRAVVSYATWCRLLIENGDLDELVPEQSIAAFKKEMDEKGVDWQFHNHARTPHGFALPPGVWAAAYSESADRRSTLSMMQMFSEVWPEFPPDVSVTRNAAGTTLFPGRL